MIEIPNAILDGPTGVTVTVILTHLNKDSRQPITRADVELKCDRRLSVNEALQVANVLERAARLAKEAIGNSF